MKLIMENWRRFINEDVTPRDLYKLDLNTFVTQIQTNKEEVLKALAAGLDDAAGAVDDQVAITTGDVVCHTLRPTQTEVVMKKSLDFTLTNPASAIAYLSSNGPFKVGPEGNDAIIVLNNKYVLDGHHRWSSLYCMNPNASIYCFNIQVNAKPTYVLKLLQASIAAYTGGALPSNPGGGDNLFTTDEATLKEYIRKKLPPAIAREFVKLGLLDLESVAPYKPEGRASNIREIYVTLENLIAHNVGILQSKSPPVEGATSREVMPQADAPQGSQVTAGGTTPAALEPLEQGMIDFRAPFAAAPAAPVRAPSQPRTPGAERGSKRQRKAAHE